MRGGPVGQRIPRRERRSPWLVYNNNHRATTKFAGEWAGRDDVRLKGARGTPGCTQPAALRRG